LRELTNLNALHRLDLITFSRQSLYYGTPISVTDLNSASNLQYFAPSNRMKTCQEDLKNRLYDLRPDGESASTHDCSFSCNCWK